MRNKTQEFLERCPKTALFQKYLNDHSFVERAVKVCEAWEIAEQLLSDFKTKYPVDSEGRSWAIYGDAILMPVHCFLSEEGEDEE